MIVVIAVVLVSIVAGAALVRFMWSGRGSHLPLAHSGRYESARPSQQARRDAVAEVPYHAPVPPVDIGFFGGGE